MSKGLMKKDARLEHLLRLLQEEENEGGIILDNKTIISKLRSITASYEIKNTFKVGDIVQWKEGLKNRLFPEYEVPAIVLAVLETPLIEAEERVGSPNYNEPLDLKLGVIDDDGDLVSFYFDGNRFELFDETA